MITRRQLFDWSVFALLAILFSLILSFRPIPNEHSANDTVRYVEELHYYCSGESSEKYAEKKASFELFYFATSLACVTKFDGIFLFEVATFLPLIFLLFSKWRNGTAILACSLMFSVYGFELMTNAMRQGFAMLLFFGAIALLEKHRTMAFALCVAAVIGHTSVLTYLPFFLWISGINISNKARIIVGSLLAIIAAVSSIVFHALIVDLFQIVVELGERYSLIYADELKPAFILFMALPLYWIYGVRLFFDNTRITEYEKKSILYSSFLLLVSYIIFPYITFRFAIFAVVLQLFLATRVETQRIKTAGFIFVGLMFQLIVMLVASNHFAVLIYG